MLIETILAGTFIAAGCTEDGACGLGLKNLNSNPRVLLINAAADYFSHPFITDDIVFSIDK